MGEAVAILIGPAGWRIGRVQGDEVIVTPVEASHDGDVAARAAAARALVSESCGVVGPVVLAIDSAMCLCATISTDGLGRNGRRRAIYFRLEEHLPISAEQMVADFVELGGERALGVCGELPMLEAIVAALEREGFEVGAIVPAATAAAEQAFGEIDDAHAAIVADAGGGVAFIATDDGGPTQWQWFAPGDGRLGEHLRDWADSQPDRRTLVQIGAVDAAAGVARALDGHQVLSLDETTADEAAVRRMLRVAAGEARPWFDLRRDALAAPTKYEKYRIHLALLAAAAVALLVSVIGVTQWRGSAYGELSAELRAEQIAVFKTALPGQRVPGSVKNRLVSEHRKLRGLGGMADDATAVTAEPSALATLHDVLTQLPRELRFRLLDVSIRPELIRIDGQALNHVDAEQIAVSLRHAGNLEVESPKTQALRDRGVSFTFTAQPRTAAAPRSEAGHE